MSHEPTECSNWQSIVTDKQCAVSMLSVNLNSATVESPNTAGCCTAKTHAWVFLKARDYCELKTRYDAVESCAVYRGGCYAADLSDKMLMIHIKSH